MSTKDSEKSAPLSSESEIGAPALLYALLSEAEATALGERLMRDSPGKIPPAIQLHPAAQIDALSLAEYATEAAQGYRIAILAGGLAGFLGGLVCGLMGWVRGLGPGLGAALGLLSGVLVGALCAAMSGHRRPCASLRTCIAQASPHERLLTIDCASKEQARYVQAQLQSSQARISGLVSGR